MVVCLALFAFKKEDMGGAFAFRRGDFDFGGWGTGSVFRSELDMAGAMGFTYY